MLLPSARSIGLLVLGTFIAFSDVLNAYDLSERRQGHGALGVTLDYSLALQFPTPINPTDTSTPRNWAFSSHIIFKDTVDKITDGQLWQLARDAATEMEADLQQYQISSKRMPTAMGVLAWGNEIILTSSQKGSQSFTYDFPYTPILESLELCQMVWGDYGLAEEGKEIHRTRGSCAEQMAAHMYYYTTDIQLPIQNARVGTWVKTKSGWGQRDPCGDPSKNEWGCNLFVQSENLHVLRNDIAPEPYDLATLAGGVEKINQIQLCSSIREDSKAP